MVSSLSVWRKDTYLDLLSFYSPFIIIMWWPSGLYFYQTSMLVLIIVFFREQAAHATRVHLFSLWNGAVSFRVFLMEIDLRGVTTRAERLAVTSVDLSTSCVQCVRTANKGWFSMLDVSVASIYRELDLSNRNTPAVLLSFFTFPAEISHVNRTVHESRHRRMIAVTRLFYRCNCQFPRTRAYRSTLDL